MRLNEIVTEHYSDVIMSAMASQITGVVIVYSTPCSGAHQRKHQSSASLAFVREIHWWPVKSPYKGPVTRKMFPFDDAIMSYYIQYIPRNMHTVFALLRFVVVIHWLIFPISIRLTSLALWQSNDCPIASKATLMNMDKYFMWIHNEWLHNHSKAKHNKSVCIFLGIYCSSGCSNNISLESYICVFTTQPPLRNRRISDLTLDSIKQEYHHHITKFWCRLIRLAAVFWN